MNRMIHSRYFRRAMAVVLIIAGCNAAFATVGFLALPPLIGSRLVAIISEKLHRNATIRHIAVNPYTLKVALKGLEIREPGSDAIFASCKDLSLHLSPRSIIRLSVVVDDLLIDDPFVSIVRNGDRTYNFEDLLKQNRQGVSHDEGAATEAHSSRFAINNVKLRGGSITFDDIPLSGRHTVENIEFSSPSLSNNPSSGFTTNATLSAIVDGALFKLNGNARVSNDAVGTEFRITLKDVGIPEYFDYIPGAQGIEAHSGALDADICVSFLRPTSEDQRINVSGDLTLRDIDISDRDGERLVKADRIEVINAIYDASEKRLTIGNVACKGPDVSIARDATGDVNLLKAIQLDPSQSQTGEASRIVVSVDSAQLEGGRLSLLDQSQGAPFHIVISPLDASLQNFSSEKNAHAAPFDIKFQTDDGESFQASGAFAPDPLTVKGALEVAGVALRKFQPFYKNKISCDIADGKLDVETRFDCSRNEKALQVRLADAKAAVHSLKVQKAGQDVMSASGISVEGGTFDLAGKQAHIDSLSISQAYAAVMRDADGALNLRQLFAPQGEAPSQANGAGDNKQPPWNFTLKRLQATDGIVYVYDAIAPNLVSFTINHLNAAVDDVSEALHDKTGASLSFSMNGKDSVSSKGKIGFSPLFADLRIDGRMDAAALRGYVPAKTQLSLIKGDFGLNGALNLTSSPPSSGCSVKFQGEASLSDFAFAGRKDGVIVFSGERLAMNMTSGYNPTTLRAKDAVLSGFYANLVLLPNGILNVQALATGSDMATGVKPASTAPVSAAPSAPSKGKEEDVFKELVVEKLRLEKGVVHFTDKRVQPAYWTSIDHIEGSITGFTLGGLKPADIDLTGKQNNYSPLHIGGKILPIRKNLLVDVNIKFTDVDMVQINPYFWKILGHNIQKGKAYLNLRYFIDKDKIDSQNVVVIVNVALGDSIESSEAINLPIKAAIAILRNGDGEIHFDIPISGSLNDPTFSFRKIIVDFLYNLVKKVITAPFAFLGLPFGGGEELRHLEFDYGSSDIGDQTKKKLDLLIKVIQDRPSLNIELEGRIDMERDREALRKGILHQKVQQQKFAEFIKKGLPVSSVEKITVPADEYHKYLKAAYEAEPFDKPKNIIGLEKSLSDAEMEALMLQHITASDDDMRLLALKRTIALRDYMVNTGGVDPGRVYLVEPETLAAERTDGVKDSRVDVRLK
ncbi:MAG: DUF748 domain-containing protein [Syntrophobacteraceae bacterium]